jgi:hypothetical protein
MITHNIQSDIEAIADDAALYEEIHFGTRAEAIDALEFNVLDRIEGLLQAGHLPERLIELRHHAEGIKRRLEAIDERLFQRLRTDIQDGSTKGAAFTQLIDTYVGNDTGGRRRRDELGYDTLDLFINGLLLSQPVPTETQTREAEMVFYQQTPARIIFELAEQAHLTHHDVFYDLGSGLGHVPILVNLLTGASARGVEFEPAYSMYASACATDLNLAGVAFINEDARTADYSNGTVFFMYTPFTGSILQKVLERLRQEAQSRTIRIFTYGPCTPRIAQQPWLERIGQQENNLTTLGEFRNCME